jgi:hypothetical protein
VGDEKFAAGNENILQFNTDMTFKMIFPPPPYTAGKYRVVIVFSGSNRNLLRLNLNSTGYADVTDSLKIEGDKLILSTAPQCGDVPYETIYERIN